MPRRRPSDPGKSTEPRRGGSHPTRPGSSTLSSLSKRLRRIRPGETIPGSGGGWMAETAGQRQPVAGTDRDRTVAQLDMLHSLGAKLNSLGDVEEIGTAITSELRSILDYHNCRVYL